MVGSGEEIFFLAAALAVLETHDGENAARGQKSHQGVEAKNRTIAVGSTCVKWQETHRDSGPVWWKTAVGPTVYLYDGKNLVEELDNTGNVLARYTQEPRIDGLLSMLRGGSTSYYEQDGINSVTSLSSSAASLANTYTFDAFGRLTASTGTLTNPFLYTGREFDAATGIYEYRARYYDQNIGRFVSEDPIRFAASPSFYVYTQNRPVNATDPTGLKLLYCSRGGFENSSPSGIGNHGYLYDTRNGHNCGRGSQSGLEDPTTPGTVCREVPGSEGHEDDVMRCCRSENKNPGQWFPWWNDCQTLAGNCLIMNNLPDPGAPGGRAGCRGKCPPPKQHETGPF